VAEFSVKPGFRRAEYMSINGAQENDDLTDFEPAARSREYSTFDLEE
jgi:hypothetical protein